MPAGKIVLAVNVLDNADVLNDFLQWYLSLGVDIVLANDCGSTDGTQDILDAYARQGVVHWSPLLDLSNSAAPSDRLAIAARDRHQAGWILLFDTDEFLVVERNDLRGALEGAAA